MPRTARRRATRLGLAGLLVATTAVAESGTASAGSTCRSVVVSAGDMNNRAAARATGRLAVAQRPDIVATVGDHVYPVGTLAAFRTTYHPSPWGDLRSRTRPVPGHHEYDDPGAGGYLRYFGRPRYYSYDAGCGWRGYALDSHRDVAAQAAWLARDLRAHPGARLLVSYSDPRHSSGTRHGPGRTMTSFWDVLAGRQAVVLNGHEHHYERFEPLRGVRQFVVGTGGSSAYPFGRPQSTSQVRITKVPGVLVLALTRGGYSWAFKDVGGRVRDAGRG